MPDASIHLPDASTIVSTIKKLLQWGRRSREGQNFIICRFNWAVLIAEVVSTIIFSIIVILIPFPTFIIPLVSNYLGDKAHTIEGFLPLLNPVILAAIVFFSLRSYIHFWRYSVTANADGISLQHGSWPFKLSWNQIYSYKEETENSFKVRKGSFIETSSANLNLDPDRLVHAIVRYISFYDRQGNRIGRLPMTFIPQNDKAKLLQIIEIEMRKQEEMRCMSVEDIKQSIIGLPKSERSELVAWLEDYRHQIWDEQIEDDLDSGRLDSLLAEVEKE